MAAEWTNATLKALFDAEGKKIRSIKSTCYQIALYIPLSGQPMLTLEDIELTTLGDTEVIKVRRYNPGTGKYFYEYCTTAMIEKVTVMDQESDIFDPYLAMF